MMSPSQKTVWQVTQPMEWPTPPEYISFSTLSELEACPRRWALRSASYPQVWCHQGYPLPLHPAALEGTVMHLAIEKITRALSDRGCPSMRDPMAVKILMELGGITAVLGESIELTLQGYIDNPRATPVLDRARKHLTGHTADMRSRIQGFLSRVHLQPRPNSKLPGDSAKDRRTLRGRLPMGAHSEVKLEVGEMGWRGVVDLLTIAETTCEIRDFKTGVPKEHHELQLRIYALLWWLDRARNPTGRLVDRIVISYDSGDVNLPSPGVNELKELRSELCTRRTAVIDALNIFPPEARPNPTNCRYCSVRHLCDAYWREPFPAEAQESRFGDLQLELTERHGPMSWDGVVEYCPRLVNGSQILLRTVDLPFDLYPGLTLRVLNVHLSPPDEDSVEASPMIALASMGAASEAFVIKI